MLITLFWWKTQKLTVEFRFCFFSFCSFFTHFFRREQRSSGLYWTELTGSSWILSFSFCCLIHLWIKLIFFFKLSDKCESSPSHHRFTNPMTTVDVHTERLEVSLGLIFCCSVWFAPEPARLQDLHVSRTCNLPGPATFQDLQPSRTCTSPGPATFQNLHPLRTLSRAGKIAADPSHPGHTLFDTLPSGGRLRSIRTRTSRHVNSFFPSATWFIGCNLEQ